MEQNNRSNRASWNLLPVLDVLDERDPWYCKL